MTKYFIQRFLGTFSSFSYTDEPLYDTLEKAYEIARSFALKMLEDYLKFGDNVNVKLSASKYGFEITDNSGQVHSVKVLEKKIDEPALLNERDSSIGFLESVADNGKVIYADCTDGIWEKKASFYHHGSLCQAKWSENNNMIAINFIDGSKKESVEMLVEEIDTIFSYANPGDAIIVEEPEHRMTTTTTLKSIFKN